MTTVSAAVLLLAAKSGVDTDTPSTESIKTILREHGTLVELTRMAMQE